MNNGKPVTGSKLRSKTPIFGRFSRSNLVPVTDFHRAFAVSRQSLLNKESQ
jgi:hypothetical protein